MANYGKTPKTMKFLGEELGAVAPTKRELRAWHVSEGTIKKV